jgi:hypothetical protein
MSQKKNKKKEHRKKMRELRDKDKNIKLYERNKI